MEDVMIEILSLDDRVAAFALKGRIDAEDYEGILRVVNAKLKEHGRIGIFADMTALEDITGEALVKDLRYGMSKLGELQRFARNALVTDKSWIAAVVETVQPFFPQMQMRVFRESERDAAKAWVVQGL
jgi:hypothetical protein